MPQPSDELRQELISEISATADHIDLAPYRFSASSGFASTFPLFTKLLANAAVWKANTRDSELAWSWRLRSGRHMIWTGPSEPLAVPNQLCENHQLLLSCFNGAFSTKHAPHWTFQNALGLKQAYRPLKIG